MAETTPPQVALIPSPGMGHLIPFVEFARSLVHRHGFTFTFVVIGEGPPLKSQQSILQSLPSSITSVFLPPVDLSDLSPSAGIEARISLTVTRSNSELRRLFLSFAAEDRLPTALVVDLFGTDAFDVAKEFHVSPYVFFPSTANVLSLCLYVPKLDETVSGEYRDLTKPVQVPGCIPVCAKDLVDPLQDRKNDAYKWLLHNTKRYKEAEGILVNSFMELEPNAIKVLQEPSPDKPTVYPVGPLVKMIEVNNQTDEMECLKWLDNQPLGSVLYVSFGSGGTLSWDQLNELALGLEKSNQRFLWVVRTPSGAANSAYFNAHSKSDPLAFLPHGFLGRIENRGLVVPSWAPQVQILAHSSTGGFLTHCGWNSTLESITNGVPLIAWPLYAEQKMNAVMLTEDIRIALRPITADGGMIKGEEIARVVKGLMEGEEGKEVRNRMKNLKEVASQVLGEDGSSTRALSEVARKWSTQQRKI